MTCHQLEPRGDALTTLQKHLPTGPAWFAWCTPGKVAFKLWQAFARSFDDANEKLCDLSTELDPRTTTDLMPEWEAALGLPDPCLPATASFEDRRNQLMFRLDKKRWTTAQDWKDLALLFGLVIVITPGWLVQKPALFEYLMPARFDLFPKLGRFRVYIDVMNVEFLGFEYGDGNNPGFPIPFGQTNENLNAFKCIIDRVKPANSIVIWNSFPEILGQHAGVFTEEYDEDFL